jgi:twitching motility protein PilT
MADLPFGAGSAPPPPPFQPPPPPPIFLAEPGGASAPGSLREMVAIAQQKQYSDIHIGVGEVPCFRVRGDIVRSDWSPTDASRFSEWLRELLSPGQIDRFLRDKEYDGAHDFGFVRVRIHLLDSLRGPAMVLRPIPLQIPSLEELNLPPVLAQLAARRQGMVLVTGASGSGRSTTLAAILNHINRTMRRHILTLEDPIEFVHQSLLSLVHQRELHQHTRGLDSALRAALREDPDVILIGEIRDQQTLSTALEACQTGHLVLGTMPTHSAVGTVEHMLGLYRPEQQERIRRSISEALLAVISQHLVKTTDGGRSCFHDLLVNTDACRDSIQRGALDQIEAIMAQSNSEGMVTSNQCLAALVQSGRVAAQEALAQSPRPGELAQRLHGLT